MLAHSDLAHATNGLASFAAGALFGLIVSLLTFGPLYVRAMLRRTGQ